MSNVVISLFIAIVFVGVGISSPLGQDSKCLNNRLLSNNASWECVERENCKSAVSIPAKEIVSCGAQSICCPNSIAYPTLSQIKEANSIALNECHKYQGYRYHNWTDYGTLIVDSIEERSEFDCVCPIEPLDGFQSIGDPVKEKEYPFMALLGFSNNVSDKTQWKCSGTLISRQYILTAAHCTEVGKNTLVKWALLGKLSRTDIIQELRYKNLFEVIERINHPFYKTGKSYNNDIALLKLEKEVPLSSSIRPICLYHDQTMANDNSKLTVVGRWGEVTGDKESDNLMEDFINFLDEDWCIDNFLDFENILDKTTMICAGRSKDGRDYCSSDSGGPMLIPIEDYKCMYLQVGVVAYRPWSCDEYTPGIYTRVSHYIPWIRSVAWSSI